MKTILKILGIIILVIFGYYIGIKLINYKDIFFSNKNNITMELKDNKKKEVYINEEDLRKIINNLMKKILQHYPKTKINQVNQIKCIYNEKEETIEYIFLYVNLNKYYSITNSYGNRFKISSVEASLSRNGVYTDSWKEKNGDNSLIFNINNLSSNCGLITEENNEILVQIKNELNDGMDNTFYWRETVY